MHPVSVLSVAFLTTASVAFGMARLHEAWEGTLVGKNGSTLKGRVSMVAGKTAGTSTVEIKMSGDAAGVTRPWHVHVGSCAKGGGPVFADAKAYTPLTVDAKGSASGKATLRVALPDSGYYYVNVHESAAKMGSIVACADLLLDE